MLAINNACHRGHVNMSAQYIFETFFIRKLTEIIECVSMKFAANRTYICPRFGFLGLVNYQQYQQQQQCQTSDNSDYVEIWN